MDICDELLSKMSLKSWRHERGQFYYVISYAPFIMHRWIKFHRKPHNVITKKQPCVVFFTIKEGCQPRGALHCQVEHHVQDKKIYFF